MSVTQRPHRSAARTSNKAKILPVFLLASRIQYIEKRDLFIDYALLSVRVLDGRVVFVHEVTLDELDGQRRLSDTTATDDDELVFSQELSFRHWV